MGNTSSLINIKGGRVFRILIDEKKKKNKAGYGGQLVWLGSGVVLFFGGK